MAFSPDFYRADQMREEGEIFRLLAECNALRKKILDHAMRWGSTEVSGAFKVAADHVGVSTASLEDGVLEEMRKYYVIKIAEAKEKKENES